MSVLIFRFPGKNVRMKPCEMNDRKHYHYFILSERTLVKPSGISNETAARKILCSETEKKKRKRFSEFIIIPSDSTA